METAEIEKKAFTLKEIFPDADPQFLQENSIKYAWKNEDFRTFVESLVLSGEYPKKVEDEKHEEDKTRSRDYVNGSKFSVELFLKTFPDPMTYFRESKLGSTYKELSLVYLKKRFRFLIAKEIAAVFSKHGYNLTLTVEALEELPPSRKSKRGNTEIPCINFEENQNFFDEVTFLDRKQEIMDFLFVKDEEKKRRREEAKQRGETLECQCCYSDDLLGEEMIPCKEGHLFCFTCVRRGAEVRIGDGYYDFPCFLACGSEFEISSLKSLLLPVTYEKVLRKRQEKEVKAARVSGLQCCPFCEYAEIPPEGDRVFRCKSCYKESCILCKKPSHIPMRCDEVEVLQARKYVEDKMSEALIRVCYKCSKKFVKVDGCNKMVCSCGAKMCYVCRMPVIDYSHFTDHRIGPVNGKCPLYSTNLDLHVKAVREAGMQAEQELLSRHPSVRLNYDPFKGLHQVRSSPRSRSPHRRFNAQ